MNKRKKKKIYQNAICDLCLEVSTDELFREKLFNSKNYTEILIDKNNMYNLPQYLKNIIVFYNLSFLVTKIDCEYDKETVIFDFTLLNYPKINTFSFNYINLKL